jgi:hypothetical protein
MFQCRSPSVTTVESYGCPFNGPEINRLFPDCNFTMSMGRYGVCRADGLGCVKQGWR